MTGKCPARSDIIGVGGHLEHPHSLQVKPHHLSALSAVAGGKVRWEGRRWQSLPCQPLESGEAHSSGQGMSVMSDLLSRHNFAVLPAICLPFWVCYHPLCCLSSWQLDLAECSKEQGLSRAVA